MIDPIKLIEEEYLAEPRDWRFPLSGSSSGFCPRRLLRLLQGAPDVPDARSRRTFEKGDQREKALADRLQRALEKRGYTVHRQYPVWTTISTDEGLCGLVAEKVRWIPKCPIRVGGVQGVGSAIEIRSHCDLVATPPPYTFDSGEVVACRAPTASGLLYEFKTANSYKFKSQKRGDAEDIERIAQVWFQHEGLVARHPGIRFEAQWVYESKDTDDLLTQPYEIDGEMHEAIEGVRNRIEDTLRAWCLASDDYAPPIHAHEDSRVEAKHKGAVGCLPWQCTYCPVGPTAGNCVPGFRVEGIPYKDKLQWELYQE